MNGWEKAVVEYTETGKVKTCPACGAHAVETEGFINGTRGSVFIRCTVCKKGVHYDGFAEMHRNADPKTVTMFE